MALTTATAADRTNTTARTEEPSMTSPGASTRADFLIACAKSAGPGKTTVLIDVGGSLDAMDADVPVTEELMRRAKAGETFPAVHQIALWNQTQIRRSLSAQRFRLLQVIKQRRPKSVYELAQMLGRDRMAVTQDLNLLRGFGLVKIRRAGRSGRRPIAPYVPFDHILVSLDLNGHIDDGKSDNEKRQASPKKDK